MSVSRGRVWACLIRADLWPDFYPNAKNVRFLNESGPDLKQGTRFTWKTFDLTITSTVLEYIPDERIAWDAQARGFLAYHAWVLTPSPKGCYVVTEESQRGWLARVNKFFRPNSMFNGHQMWLQNLEERA